MCSVSLASSLREPLLWEPSCHSSSHARRLRLAKGNLGLADDSGLHPGNHGPLHASKDTRVLGDAFVEVVRKVGLERMRDVDELGEF